LLPFLLPATKALVPSTLSFSAKGNNLAIPTKIYINQNDIVHAIIVGGEGKSVMHLTPTIRVLKPYK